MFDAIMTSWRSWTRFVVPIAGMDVEAGEERRFDLFMRLLAGFFLLSIAFSRMLWLSSRSYPMVPLAGLVPPFPFPLDIIALALLCGLLFALIWKPRSRQIAIGLLIVLAILFLQDTDRLWPSFYEYALLLLLAAMYQGVGDASRVLNACRFVMAAAYFWSGFLKLTPSFFFGQFPLFIQAITAKISIDPNVVALLGIAAALFEVIFACALLSKRFRAFGLLDALSMHVLIFFFIGPLRGNMNDSAWIWSNATAAFVFVLFFRAPAFEIRSMVRPSRIFDGFASAAALLFIGVMPFFNNFNLWPSPLSFNVYTGNVSSAEMVLDQRLAHKLPGELAKYAYDDPNGFEFDFGSWSADEFNANPIPETGSFKAILLKVCSYDPGGYAELTITPKSGWFASGAQRRYTCGTGPLP